MAIDHVLHVIGGMQATRKVASCLAFDTTTNQWNDELALPSLPEPLCKIGCTRWRNLVVVIGGSSNDVHAVPDVWALDLDTRTWSNLPPLNASAVNWATIVSDGVLILNVRSADRVLVSEDEFDMKDVVGRCRGSVGRSGRGWVGLGEASHLLVVWWSTVRYTWSAATTKSTRRWHESKFSLRLHPSGSSVRR